MATSQIFRLRIIHLILARNKILIQFLDPVFHYFILSLLHSLKKKVVHIWNAKACEIVASKIPQMQYQK